MVAIPAYFLAFYFLNRVSKFILDMQKSSIQFLDGLERTGGDDRGAYRSDSIRWEATTLKFKRRLQGDEEGIPITNLVDVLFLLIVFFMMSTVLSFDRGYGVKLPQSSAAGTISNKGVSVMIARDGKVYVDGSETPLDRLGDAVKVAPTHGGKQRHPEKRSGDAVPGDRGRDGPTSRRRDRRSLPPRRRTGRGAVAPWRGKAFDGYWNRRCTSASRSFFTRFCF